MDSDKFLEGQSMQRPPLFESDGNSQVKDNKIDLFVQQYEQFVISEDESIDSAFARFNTIITSLKALDEGYSGKNCVRKFLKALHPKWRAKKDSEIVKGKGEKRSFALKAKKESSDKDSSTSESENEEYAMAVRDFKKFFKRRGRCGDRNDLIGECPKPPRDKNQRAFVRGSWSDSGEEDYENAKDETYLIAQASSEPDEWIKDSGCIKHMTCNRKLFSTYKAYNGGNVIFSSKLRGNIIGKGAISHDSLNIANLEHVDNLGFNFLSVSQIYDNKCKVMFFENDSEIIKDGKVISRGIRKSNLYVMKLGNKPKDKICLTTIKESATLWDRRIGHANIRLIQSLASKELVRNLPKLKFDQHFCDACKIRKQAHASHKAKNMVPTTRCLELLHMDLFGPSVVQSYGGNLYTLVIVEDYYRKDHNREFDNEVIFEEFCNASGGRKPTIDYLKVFGSKCFILNTKDYLTKFDPKSYEGVFLGYSQNSKVYIIINKHTIKIKESLNVTFDETPPSSKTSPLVDDDLDKEEAIKVTEKKNLENDIEDENLEIDEIVNIKESKNYLLDNVIGNLNQRTLRSQVQNQSNFFRFILTIKPKNVSEALKDESWIIAMQEELNQFIANDVWELVPQPKNMTIIGTKWVFRNKLDKNEIVSRNKARLVAQGYNQQEGIDYDEAYAHVARLDSIWILLAYACALDFKLFQMDVKSAFLNGFINEDVYVAQPLGFIDFKKPNHVYKLEKALYGLKQAPNAWSQNLTSERQAYLFDTLKDNLKMNSENENDKVNMPSSIDGSDVTDHIAKVLKITEWIKIPNVDKDELRLHVFSKSLSGNAEKWWNNEGTPTT
ncbi:retrovirus-related pol polyprotein from transposon TNT 1-94 [Tanacetum coccineum]